MQCTATADGTWYLRLGGRRGVSAGQRVRVDLAVRRAADEQLLGGTDRQARDRLQPRPFRITAERVRRQLTNQHLDST